MAAVIRRVDYYYATVRDRPGEAYVLLSQLAAADVNLLAFNVIPMGSTQTQLVLFPENADHLARAAQQAGMVLSGPQRAFLIQGDDELGALVGIHHKLFDARINVYASSGVTGSCRDFGYIIYVRPDDYERAAAVLGT